MAPEAGFDGTTGEWSREESAGRDFFPVVINGNPQVIHHAFRLPVPQFFDLYGTGSGWSRLSFPESSGKIPRAGVQCRAARQPGQKRITTRAAESRPGFQDGWSDR